jgi:hypothetical protein
VCGYFPLSRKAVLRPPEPFATLRYLGYKTFLVTFNPCSVPNLSIGRSHRSIAASMTASELAQFRHPKNKVGRHFQCEARVLFGNSFDDALRRLDY